MNPGHDARLVRTLWQRCNLLLEDLADRRRNTKDNGICSRWPLPDFRGPIPAARCQVEREHEAIDQLMIMSVRSASPTARLLQVIDRLVTQLHEQNPAGRMKNAIPEG